MTPEQRSTLKNWFLFVGLITVCTLALIYTLIYLTYIGILFNHRNFETYIR